MTPASVMFGLAGSPAQEGVTNTPGRCAICAVESSRTALFDRWQGANFTDQNKIRAWGETRVCEPCIWAHGWNPPPGFPPQEPGKKGVNLRLYSHLWGERTGYRYANKASKDVLREWIRTHASYRTERCFAAIADTGQKHVIPWTRLNLPGSRPLVVRFEEKDVIVGSWALVLDLTELLTDGVTKDEIAGCDYRLLSWQQSRKAVEAFEATHGHIRGSAWWTFALWLAQRDEEEHARRSDDRRTARAVAKADRGADHGSKGRVPRGSRKEPAHALGPDQGSNAGVRQDERVSERVGDEPVQAPVAPVARQASLFDDL